MRTEIFLFPSNVQEKSKESAMADSMLNRV